MGFLGFIQGVIFVLMIGTVNLWVSFSITLWVALRSRETKIDSWVDIARCVKQIAKERPLSLFLPTQLPEPVQAAKKNQAEKLHS